MLGLLVLFVREKIMHKILWVLIAFSAGTILGTAYLELLPEALEIVGNSEAFIYITVGFVAFFFLERYIYWSHGHSHEFEDVKSPLDSRMTKNFAYLNVIGDGIHNFVDGMIIATSFLIEFEVGLAATIAVIFHELPQELGDYGILIYSGFKRNQALIINFMAALTVVLGGVFAIIFIEAVEALSGLLLAFSAGGFIYLAASELIPELQEEKRLSLSLIQFTIFILGIMMIWSLGLFFHE
jgi:zinc and cadmium transporter